MQKYHLVVNHGNFRFKFLLQRVWFQDVQTANPELCWRDMYKHPQVEMYTVLLSIQDRAQLVLALSMTAAFSFDCPGQY